MAPRVDLTEVRGPVESPGAEDDEERAARSQAGSADAEVVDAVSIDVAEGCDAAAELALRRGAVDLDPPGRREPVEIDQGRASSQSLASEDQEDPSRATASPRSGPGRSVRETEREVREAVAVHVTHAGGHATEKSSLSRRAKGYPQVRQPVESERARQSRRAEDEEGGSLRKEWTEGGGHADEDIVEPVAVDVPDAGHGGAEAVGAGLAAPQANRRLEQLVETRVPAEVPAAQDHPDLAGGGAVLEAAADDEVRPAVAVDIAGVRQRAAESAARGTALVAAAVVIQLVEEGDRGERLGGELPDPEDDLTGEDKQHQTLECRESLRPAGRSALSGTGCHGSVGRIREYA